MNDRWYVHFGVHFSFEAADRSMSILDSLAKMNMKMDIPPFKTYPQLHEPNIHNSTLMHRCDRTNKYPKGYISTSRQHSKFVYYRTEADVHQEPS